MRHRIALGSVLISILSAIASGYITIASPFTELPDIASYPVDLIVSKLLLVSAVVLVLWGIYLVTIGLLMQSTNKRRAHNTRNLLRLAFGFVGLIATLAILTEHWVGLLLSLGVIGFAITFALQQPLLSLIGWMYIAVKQPYGVGDRVKIDDAKGDVIAVDFLVTTLWEINGELVTSDQPSGRVVTVPNSVVLSQDVANYGGGGSPFVWNEIRMQVAYETDLAFVRQLMQEEADDLLGDEMAAHIEKYREALAETPVELEVYDRPSVNVIQRESWIELQLRYLTDPRRGQRVKNEMYERVLARFKEYPDRVSFPVSRSR